MIPTQSIRKTAFWLGLALPFFALLATVWVTHVTNGQFNAAFASVTKTYNVLNILEQTQAQVADAETGQRGWLLTRRPDYYALYDTAMAALNNNVQKLQILLRDNPAGETGLTDLQSLIARRLSPSSDIVAFAKTNSTGTVAVLLTDAGRDTMNQIRNALFRMREEQANLLRERQQNAEARFLFDQTASLILVGITTIALLAIVAVVIRLEHMRQIVTICAWTGRVKFGNEWISLEDYLRQRFGVSVSHGLSKQAAEKMIREIRQANPGQKPQMPASE